MKTVMLSLLVLFSVSIANAQKSQNRSGSFYGGRNSEYGRMNDGTRYSRYNNTTRQYNQQVPRSNINGLNNYYSNGIKRQQSNNHTYDYGTANRMGITRPYGGGTRTYYSNGQVDTQRGNYLKQERYNPRFPLPKSNLRPSR